jgi:hypothetical protein
MEISQDLLSLNDGERWNTVNDGYGAEVLTTGELSLQPPFDQAAL